MRPPEINIDLPKSLASKGGRLLTSRSHTARGSRLKSNEKKQGRQSSDLDAFNQPQLSPRSILNEMWPEPKLQIKKLAKSGLVSPVSHRPSSAQVSRVKQIGTSTKKAQILY